MVQEDLKKKGYNKEEEYFQKLNKKLIKDKIKKDLKKGQEDLPKEESNLSDEQKK